MHMGSSFMLPAGARQKLSLSIAALLWPLVQPDQQQILFNIKPPSYTPSDQVAPGRQSINQSKRKTSNANGQTNLGHKHKAPDHNHEATQPMVDLPHTS